MASSRTRTAAAVAFAGLLAIVAGCSSGSTNDAGSTAAGAGDGTCKIGFVVINQQDIFFTQMVQGARKQAKKVGCELSVANANNDAAKQSSDIERLVAQGVDGIIADPIDVNGTNPAIDSAREQGVKIISIDTNIGKEHYDSFVGVDNGKAAQQFGHYMLNHGFAKSTKYGVVDARNSQIQNVREDEFKKVVNKAGAKFTQAVSGENQNEKAATAAENLLTAQQNLDFVYTTGTPATLGATSALTGRPGDQPTVVGWDLSKDIIQGIDNGIVQAVVQQDARGEGIASVKEMKRLIDGKKPKGEVLIPITIVTKDNVDQFRHIYE